MNTALIVLAVWIGINVLFVLGMWWGGRRG